MARVFLLFLAVIFCTLASLTVLKAPSLFTWKLAILAGEFGQFLWLVPLLLGAITFARSFSSGRTGLDGAMVWITIGFCALAVLLFLRPSFNASQLAKRLPQQLEQAFGKANVGRSPYAFFSLGVGHGSKKVSPETRVFAFAGTPDALSLDFYRAAVSSMDPPEGRPCVLVVHPGGWDSGTRDQLSTLNSYLAGRGYAVATIDYRLAPRFPWPAQREDVQTAMAYLKTHAGELGIDPTRFVLLGRSAGGQIAEAVAYQNPDPSLRGVIALYAPADLEFAWKYAREDDVLNSFLLLKQYLGGSPEFAPEKYRHSSGYFHVSHATVPTLLAHGQIDSLVWHKQSERLAARLTEENVPHVFLDLPWATHAFDYTLGGPSGQLTTYAIEWFLAAEMTAGGRG